MAGSEQVRPVDAAPPCADDGGGRVREWSSTTRIRKPALRIILREQRPQARPDIGFLVARRNDHRDERRLLGRWRRRAARRGRSPRCLTARAISHAMIASHAEDNRSSTALRQIASPAGTALPLVNRRRRTEFRLSRAFPVQRDNLTSPAPPANSARRRRGIAASGIAQFLAHHVGAEHQRHHLVKGMAAAHALAAHAAIGRDHQPLGRNVFERGADLRRHLVRRLHLQACDGR